jgi:hypothetical protein
MDPYLEDPDIWPDVRFSLLTEISAHLAPQLRPRFVIRIQECEFSFHHDDPAAILYTHAGVIHISRSKALEKGTWQARRRFLEIREAKCRTALTAIALVSHAEKLIASAGRQNLLSQRDAVTANGGNWLELDLLRDGIPTIQNADRAASAYCAYLDRAIPGGRQQVICPISLQHCLPRVSVPVLPDGPDVRLDLQAVLDSAYDRAVYAVDTDYGRPPVPPLNASDAAWAAPYCAIAAI